MNVRFGEKRTFRLGWLNRVIKESGLHPEADIRLELVKRAAIDPKPTVTGYRQIKLCDLYFVSKLIKNKGRLERTPNIRNGSSCPEIANYV